MKILQKRTLYPDSLLLVLGNGLLGVHLFWLNGGYEAETTPQLFFPHWCSTAVEKIFKKFKYS